MARPTNITLDLGALKHNVACVRRKAPFSKIIAMSKANAYGHGLCVVGKSLGELTESIGVAFFEEGVLLREEGILSDIVLIEGVFSNDELVKAAKYDFTLVVHQLSQIEMLEKFSAKHVFRVWLKIDTGMHRLGVDPSDVQNAWLRLVNCSSVKRPVGLMSHFAETEVANSSEMRDQTILFNKLTGHLPGPRSLAKSNAVLSAPDTHLDWVRPGIILYGASPWHYDQASEYGLLPVMTFCSALMAIRRVAKNESIGYGSTWSAPEEMLIGVVAVGYGDGYPQTIVNGTPVLVNGRICPLVGRVSMDMLTVDLRSSPEAKIGDSVTLWGEGLPVEHIAKHNNCSSYELLTRVTQRVSVKVKDKDKPKNKDMSYIIDRSNNSKQNILGVN